MKNIEIFWRPNCKFCEMAKNLLSSKGIDYTLKEIGVDISVEYFKMVNPNIKTVPAIFVDSIYIGGYTELKEMVDNGDI